MIIADPAVPGTRHLGLGLKLYPSNKHVYSTNILLNSFRVFLKYAKIEEMKESLR